MCEGPSAFFKHASGDTEEALCFRWQTQQVQLATWVAGDWKRINLCLSPAHVSVGASTAGVPQGRWCVPCCLRGQQRFDTSFQMAASPDVKPGLRKVLLERLLLYLCCRSPVCSHTWVTHRGEIKKHINTPPLKKSPFFLAFLEIKGIFPKLVFLPAYTKEIVLMCTLEIGIKLASSGKEEPY